MAPLAAKKKDAIKNPMTNDLFFLQKIHAKIIAVMAAAKSTSIRRRCKLEGERGKYLEVIVIVRNKVQTKGMQAPKINPSINHNTFLNLLITIYTTHGYKNQLVESPAAVRLVFIFYGNSDNPLTRNLNI